jgi:predicted nucleotidyltransferase
MDPLGRVASELRIPERTLRRAASEGLIRGERVSPRRFQVTLREESYLRTHWALLRRLRAALRTEPNVRLAVLFGSTATGDDDEGSDLDIMVALKDPDLRRLAELAERLSRALSRNVQLIRISDARGSPALMVAMLEHGRVLVDRDASWSGLQQRTAQWRHLARRSERSLPVALGAVALDDEPA